jgi:hypothetical protein
MTVDPYQTRKSKPDADENFEGRHKHLVQGQKFLIYAVGCLGLFSILQQFSPELGAAGYVITLVLSTIGMVRAVIGLNYHVVVKVLLVLFVFVPLVNLIAILVVNHELTKTLRADGFKVGFFGIKT